MVTKREFARFKRNGGPMTSEAPAGGLCLSCFVIISKKGRPSQVLMGKLNVEANWDHLGALDAERASKFSGGWMLPSSHLMLQETPGLAAERILAEQLGLTYQKLEGPVVFSEVYGANNHWDVSFIYTGELEGEVAPHPAWKELRFVDLGRIGQEDIARSHEDILAQVGKWPPP